MATPTATSSTSAAPTTKSALSVAYDLLGYDVPADVAEQTTMPLPRHQIHPVVGVFRGRPVRATQHALGRAILRYYDEMRVHSIPAAMLWLGTRLANAEVFGEVIPLEYTYEKGQHGLIYGLRSTKDANAPMARVVVRRLGSEWMVITVLPREGSAG